MVIISAEKIFYQMFRMRFLATLTIMSVVMAPPGAELLGHHKKYKNCKHLNQQSKINDGLLVTTKSGKIKGDRETAANGCPVDMWWGIPYAEPPIGELRYKRPVPISRWRKTLKANSKPNACVQIPDTMFPGFSGAEMWNPNTLISEDCLYLNIAVPTPRPKSSAVLFWIYGGSFFSGSSSLDVYDPKVLASEENIIVVSIQYRVGSLGFLYLGTEDAPGNQGLLDQRLAMKWVKENINFFGGNNDNITLFSESAGSTSVSFQLLSPGSREYFSQAILQSAAATNPWGMVTRKEGQLRTLRLAENSDCPHSGDDLSATAYCLRNVDANTLANNEFNAIVYGICGFPFTPVLDGEFFPESPRRALARKNYKMANILLGTNKDEGNYFNIYYLSNILKKEEEIPLNRTQFEQSVFELNVFVPPVGKQAIEFEYTNWLHPDNSSHLINAMDKMVGDYQFTCPVLEFAQAYATTRNDVYLYYFTHRSSQNLWPKWCGVMHADEISYVFGEPFNKTHFSYTPEEVKLSKTMMSYWANFAKTGNPNKNSNGSWTPVYWPLHTSRGKEYLELSTTNMTQGKGHHSRKCAFWNSYLPSLIASNSPARSRDGQCEPKSGSTKNSEPCPEPLTSCKSRTSTEEIRQPKEINNKQLEDLCKTKVSESVNTCLGKCKSDYSDLESAITDCGKCFMSSLGTKCIQHLCKAKDKNILPNSISFIVDQLPFCKTRKVIHGKNSEGDIKGDSKNTTIGDALKAVPFQDSRFYVPSSYSAGPDPKRASMPISSGYMSTVNVVVIIFFVLLSTGAIIVSS